MQPSRSDSVIYSSPFINGIGNEPKVLGFVFNPNAKGTVSSPINGNSGVFVIKTESIYMRPSQSLDYASKRVQVEQAIKGSFSYRASESLKKSADIEDNRIKFY
jgi:peptidyl-prolyl cis-trans isomerase D